MSLHKRHWPNGVVSGQGAAPDIYRQDCNTALNLFIRDVSRYEERDTKWLSIGVPASWMVPGYQRTPKRYTFSESR